MNLQVIVSTMFQKDYSLLDQMNILSDAVVVNQCDEDNVSRFLYNGKQITWINSDTRGVGKSRNLGITYSHEDADIILFSDEDVVYNDSYCQKVLNFFESNPKCSLAVFNILSLNSERPEFQIKKVEKLYHFNCLRYGAARIAVKRKLLLEKGVMFSVLFGGGGRYQAGEDNLFITQCIRKGFDCYTCPEVIGTAEQKESTWFKGYNEKYYADRGALFQAMFRKTAMVYLLLMNIKEQFRKKSNISFLKRLKYSYLGMQDYKNLLSNGTSKEITVDNINNV